MNISLDFPQRYEPQKRLGSGGGGEVWAVLDRFTGESYALKVLAEEASEHELDALVREAVALSGLEGLGVPQVLRFGRLARSRRPFMVRELVAGESLEALIAQLAPWGRTVEALCAAAEQLTQVHRAGFFHGDVKPANIIVGDTTVTLVDLGLSARFRERGAQVRGLTPKYAAPELLAGGALTVRAEVYALGIALRDILATLESNVGVAQLKELDAVALRATTADPAGRYPSADEFAAALRTAAQLPAPDVLFQVGSNWPVLGIETTAGRLLRRAIAHGPGEVLALFGPESSGRTVMLRRLAWALGVEGRPLVWVDAFLAASPAALESELSAFEDKRGVAVLVDDVERLDADALSQLRTARLAGASLIVVAERELSAEVFDTTAEPFEMPKLSDAVALDLLKRSVPSLTEPTARRLLLAANGLPGELRRIVELLASKPVVSEEDVDEILLGGGSTEESRFAAADALERAVQFLNRGRYNEAKEALDAVVEGDALVLAVARARLNVGLGDGRAALEALLSAKDEANRRCGSPEAQFWKVWLGRAHVALAQHDTALAVLREIHDAPGSIGAEALAFEGLALHYLGDHAGACATFTRAIEIARDVGDARVQALALNGLGLIQQRADAPEEAEQAYQQALVCARKVGDAGALGTAQLNLAVLYRVQGDVARAIEHFEAALDMGRRSGRRMTVRYALLGIANVDLYLGRLARAEASIASLSRQRASLSGVSAAQLLGSEAELALKRGDYERSVELFKRCAADYERLGAAVNCAEAQLEGVLAAVRTETPNTQELAEEVARARARLADSPAHRALVGLAAARVALVAGDDDRARLLLAGALSSAQEASQRDWIWRVLEARAELEEAAGQGVTARRDRLEAVTVLEEIGARLSRDLREVFWNDPRRRQLRESVEGALTHAPTQLAYVDSVGRSSISSPISAFTRTPLEQRLARLLEINQDLLGELDLDALTAKAIEYAVDLVRAERGFVILRDDDGALKVYSSSRRAEDPAEQEFSTSIAEQVMRTREAFCSAKAQDDARLQSYRSVHQLMLEGVACVPILARLREPIGALYVETRQHVGERFEKELPTLRAFADQVALAIETQRLIAENRKRAAELEDANVQLEAAQVRLKESLGQRTETLKATRKELKAARDVIMGHFGYQGIVGTSEPMRRCYALIDRVRDTEVPVLITGESGTGKELVARALHRGSVRGKLPFLGINCGAIPEHLLESELFGHVRGAFTGADKARPGLIREAGAGTVLLDEIGEMPHKMQAGLLRVLQERKVRPVGGASEEDVQCRFVFATHRGLEEMVRAGTFREDLFYRIQVVEIRLPALRERMDDVPLLVDHFLRIFAARYERPKKALSKDALALLASYDWPGNVRQLEHVLLNAWVMSDESEVEADDIVLPSRASKAPRPPTDGVRAAPPAAAPVEAPQEKPRQTLSSHRRSEKERIIEALERANWNRVKAAELAGIPRRTFYRRLREYDIQ